MKNNRNTLIRNKLSTKEVRMRGLTILKADMAEKYGAPVYSRHPPMTAILPDLTKNGKIELIRLKIIKLTQLEKKQKHVEAKYTNTVVKISKTEKV